MSTSYTFVGHTSSRLMSNDRTCPWMIHSMSNLNLNRAESSLISVTSSHDVSKMSKSMNCHIVVTPVHTNDCQHLLVSMNSHRIHSNEQTTSKIIDTCKQQANVHCHHCLHKPTVCMTHAISCQHVCCSTMQCYRHSMTMSNVTTNQFENDMSSEKAIVLVDNLNETLSSPYSGTNVKSNRSFLALPSDDTYRWRVNGHQKILCMHRLDFVDLSMLFIDWMVSNDCRQDFLRLFRVYC
jgi:hypothetical protein